MKMPDDSKKSGDSGRHLESVIRELYSSLNREQCQEAEVNLRRYFEIALAIAEETLTSTPSVPTIRERSNVELKT
jgi:hypothetical protein